MKTIEVLGKKYIELDDGSYALYDKLYNESEIQPLFKQDSQGRKYIGEYILLNDEEFTHVSNCVDADSECINYYSESTIYDDISISETKLLLLNRMIPLDKGLLCTTYDLSLIMLELLRKGKLTDITKEEAKTIQTLLPIILMNSMHEINSVLEFALAKEIKYPNIDFDSISMYEPDKDLLFKYCTSSYDSDSISINSLLDYVGDKFVINNINLLIPIIPLLSYSSVDSVYRIILDTLLSTGEDLDKLKSKYLNIIMAGIKSRKAKSSLAYIILAHINGLNIEPEDIYCKPNIMLEYLLKINNIDITQMLSSLVYYYGTEINDMTYLMLNHQIKNKV